MSRKIAVFETEAWERSAFDTLQDQHECVFRPEALTAEIAKEHADADIISTFINSDLGSDVLQSFEDLQFVATRSTGVDHIDLEYCKEHGIEVSNVPSYGDNTVAEHTMGLLLTISHNLNEAIDRTRRGDFSLQGLKGFDLEGKVLGVIGTGEIGRRVIEMAKGFRMEVLAFDVVEDEASADRLGFNYTDMDDLLANADVLTIHVPGNEKTRHLLGHEEFAKMKDGAVLLNTARGEVVDMEALARALVDGTIRAAGVDVLSNEPVIREEAELLRSVYQAEHELDTLLAGHVLMRLSNVVVTPHSAFYTEEAVQRILDTTLANIEAFLDGEVQNAVTNGGEQ